VARLFSKNLSEHNAAAYNELCEGVGVKFWAALSPFVTQAGIATPCGDPCAEAHEMSRLQERRRPHCAKKPETGGAARGRDETAMLVQRATQLQERLDAAEARKRLLEQELETARSEGARLKEEHHGTTQRAICVEILLCKCLDMLSSLPTGVTELKEEISEALGRNAFGMG